MTEEVKTAPDTRTHDEKMIAAVAAAPNVTMNGETLQPDPAAAEAAAKAKADTDAAATEKAKPTRPENVPEKFWNADTGQVNTEALLKSYTELEKKSTAAPAKEQTPEEKAAAEKAQAEAPVPVKALFNTAVEEFAKDGKLTAASLAALEKAGLTAADIEDQAALLKIAAEAITNKAFAVAGGKERYGEMIAWARSNLNETEIKAFDTQLRDPNLVTSAVKGLYARYSMEGAKDGKLQMGGGGGQGAGDVFKSSEEVTVAVNAPRYKKDANYRAEVGAKLLRSKKAGGSFGINI